MNVQALSAILRFTLDTSCVISAVNHENCGGDIEELVTLCGQGAGELWLTTAFDEDQETASAARRAANERWISERPFTGRIGQPFRLDFSVLDGRSILIDDRTGDAIEAIEQILLPAQLRRASLAAGGSQVASRWRKRIKDVQHLGAHYFHRHDVFVTTDYDDMLKRRDELLRRTGIVIENPAEAAERARNALAGGQRGSAGKAAPPPATASGGAAPTSS